MMSSVIPARLVFQCGHAALVSLPRVKGESSVQRADRVAREKSAAHSRACDFCAQHLEVVVQQAAPPAPVAAAEPVPVGIAPPPPISTPPVTELPVASTPIVPVAPVAPVAPVSVAAPVVPVIRRIGMPRIKKVQPAAPVIPVVAESAPRKPLGRPRRVALRVPRPADNGRIARPAQNGHVTGSARFIVEFQVETVLRAADLRDALRQAQALGAVEVLAIADETT